MTRSVARIFAALLTALLTGCSATASLVESDVCVYGGTSGGVVAAAQASRLGKSVVLIEPGQHLGGMTSGGLSWTDIGSSPDRVAAVGGMARNVYERIGARYGQKPGSSFDSPDTSDPTRGGVDFAKPPALAFEPKIAEAVFIALAREAQVKVYFGRPIASASKQGKMIRQITTADGSIFRAKMFIDASYEGDLLAKAGISHTVGREANARYAETVNGIQKPADNPRAGKFEVPIDPWVVRGDPKSGPLPYLLKNEPLGEVGAADKRVQSYNYRVCLTDDPANRIPLAKPADYDPARYELLARWIESRIAGGQKLTLRGFLKYDPLPNHKYDFNNRWPISTDYIGGADAYPEANDADRRRIAREHESYLRGFFYFLGHDPRVPQAVRDEMNRFGLPKDEFTDAGGWPNQLYVREARRMIGDFVMTEHHCRGRKTADRPIGLGTYGIDMHAVRRIIHEGRPANEGSNGAPVPQPYPIGYGAIVPKAAECSNLFATFALSASHVAFGSIRMEPVFMNSSQSAASAACIAIDDGVAAQQVDYAKLRGQMLADGQVLRWPPVNVAAKPAGIKTSPGDLKLDGIVIDDDQAQYTGDWGRGGDKLKPLLGPAYHLDGNKDRGRKTATFTVALPAAGDYDLRLIYTSSNNRASKVKVTIQAAGGLKTVHVNQRRPAAVDGALRSLGVFRFNAGQKAIVTIHNQEADGYVIVDGLQILPPESAKAAATVEEPVAAAAKPPLEKVRLAVAAAPENVDGKSYDVAVIGATPAGIAAAVRAARQGVTVLLTQHNGHIGGMMTNGLMQWDALYGGRRSAIFTEILGNIENHYRRHFGEDSRDFQIARFSQDHYPMGWAEPHVAEREFNRLVAGEPNITLLLNHHPAKVQRDGPLLGSLKLRKMGGSSDIRIKAGVYIDAMYEGDLAALAQVPCRAGREARGEYNEPHAGRIFTNIDSRKAPSAAVEGKLNIHPYSSRQGTIDPAGPFTADRAVQAYNTRFCVTNDPDNRLLPGKPPGYNREEYLHYDRKSIATNPGPNSKSHMNSPILPGENHDYPEGDWATREKITRRHTDFGLGLMYFLQNDESVPARQRENFRQWGLSRDEFADNNHVPYEMYVRETRRIVGRHVYTEHDNSLAPGIGRTPIHPDSIAITDWYMDSHSCTKDQSPGYKYEGKLILTEESRPGQIPYRSLLPRGVDNLIVPVCMSTTHVSWGAVRLEPVWMQTGEAAGTAAAMAIRSGKTPAALNPDLLVRALIKGHCLVSFFNDVSLDRPAAWNDAIQYLGTRGFFADYDARPNDPLTADTARLWARGKARLASGNHDPMALARDLARLSQDKSGIPVTHSQFAALLNITPVNRNGDPPLTRGSACRMIAESLGFTP